MRAALEPAVRSKLPDKRPRGAQPSDCSVSYDARRTRSLSYVTFVEPIIYKERGGVTVDTPASSIVDAYAEPDNYSSMMIKTGHAQMIETLLTQGSELETNRRILYIPCGPGPHDLDLATSLEQTIGQTQKPFYLVLVDMLPHLLQHAAQEMDSLLARNSVLQKFLKVTYLSACLGGSVIVNYENVQFFVSSLDSTRVNKLLATAFGGDGKPDSIKMSFIFQWIPHALRAAAISTIGKLWRKNVEVHEGEYLPSTTGRFVEEFPLHISADGNHDSKFVAMVKKLEQIYPVELFGRSGLSTEHGYMAPMINRYPLGGQPDHELYYGDLVSV